MIPTPAHKLPNLLLAAGTALLAMSAGAVPSDADKPASIEADSCTYDHNAATSVCTGAVEVHQGTLMVAADRVQVDYRERQVIRMTAQGQPARYEQQLEAERGKVRADANTIVYHTAEERVELLGDAQLRQEGNNVRGQVINYDIVAGRIIASGDRVKVILPPAEPSRNE